MDPAEERRDSKKKKDHINMLRYTCDSEYGIPRRCSCGGRMIDEVRAQQEYDTNPGKWFFTCANYEADGFHYRQPWVFGVQEQVESLTKHMEKAEEVMKLVPTLQNDIQTLEAKAKGMARLVDCLSAEVYNLKVQVDHLEKLCFE